MSYKIAKIWQPGSGNAKIAHGNKWVSVMTLSLSASDSAGVGNTCPIALPYSEVMDLIESGMPMAEIAEVAKQKGKSFCSGSCCVNASGRGRMANVQGARANLTRWFFEDRGSFISHVCEDAGKMLLSAEKNGIQLVARPNTNSDEPWETIAPELFLLPGFSAYDYTKLSKRLGKTPKNYHLTYSVSDATTEKDWQNVHNSGANIAVVFDVEWQPNGAESARKYGVFPTDWTDPTGYRWPVIDGDAYDARLLDPKKVCVGLRLKGGIDGRELARCSGFADCRFSGGLSVSMHPSLTIL